MSNFHGGNKKKDFFEGWYFKHQGVEETISFIPGINIDSKGNKYAFIQIITTDEVYNIKFNYSEFSCSEKKFNVQIEKNIFSEDGIEIDIHTSEIHIVGKITYGRFKKLNYNIMGPFSLIPFLECNHGIESLYHTLDGSILLNGKEIIFNNGVGYIEKDWGSSFPKTYLWIQCNDFSGGHCIVVAIADIPFMNWEFRGCICVINYKNKEYRFATYNRGKVLEASNKGVIIQKGKYILHIEVEENNPQGLLAPKSGNMNRIIHENITCRATFKLYEKEKMIFYLNSEKCSFEYVQQ